MKKHIQTVLNCIATLFLTVIILVYMTNILERKSSDAKYNDFFCEEENFDVLFMGTSHVLNAIFPMELWNDYKITSYNFGGHSNEIATSYWVMKNALDYTKPKLIVIDCFGVENELKSAESFSYLHLSLDAFPLSKTKIQTTWDLLNDPNQGKEGLEPRTKMELLWNYSIYHSRWNSLSKDDFIIQSTGEKGAELRIGISQNRLNSIDEKLKLESGSIGDIYLRKMITECQKNNIEVLLVYLPFPATEKNQMAANYVDDIAKEYGINYINFLKENVIDYDTDLYDSNSHLNASGARKITGYLGKYIRDNYNIASTKSEKEIMMWDADYQIYTGIKNSFFQREDILSNYLILLSNDDIEYIIDVRDFDKMKNVWIKKLFENAGVNYDFLNDNVDFILIGKRGINCLPLNDFRINGNCAETQFGKIQYFEMDSKYGLYIDGVECLVGDYDKETNMQIVVMREKEVIDKIKVQTYNNISLYSGLQDIEVSR